MLRINRQSIEAQTDRDFEHLFIQDMIGRGIGWANRELITVRPTSDYVLVLDDDDLLTEPKAVEYLKEATANNPDIVIFKGDHGALGVLPSAGTWGKRPLKGQIGSCDFISHRDIWMKHISAFGVDEGGDYAYLESVWQDKPVVVWLDKELTAVQYGRSYGVPE
jgi:hypothetical protein